MFKFKKNILNKLTSSYKAHMGGGWSKWWRLKLVVLTGAKHMVLRTTLNSTIKFTAVKGVIFFF